MKRHPLSGSNMERRRLCPGSLKMEAGIPEPPSSSQAEEGTMFHGLVADPTKPRSHLTGQQLDLIETAESVRTEWIQSIKEKHRLGEPSEVLVEQEFWAHDGVKPVYVIHPDLVMVWPNVVAVCDYKFGFDPVTKASSNDQLRAYLVALAEEYEANYWYGAIIQPRCDPLFHSTVYNWGTIGIARREILEVCRTAMAPDAPMKPHPDACRYCRGLQTAHCPEVRFSTVLLATQWNHAIAPADQLSRLAPQDRTRLFEMLERAEQIIAVYWKAGEEEAAKNPGFIPGYELKAGAPRFPINNPTEVWKRSEREGVSIEAFMGTITVRKEKLSEVIRAVTKLKGKALEDKNQAILAGCTDTNPTKATLKRVE